MVTTEEIAPEAIEIQDVDEQLEEERRCGHPLRNALFVGTVVGGAALAGKLATDTGSKWYRKLDKPEWQPEPEVFPIAWASLYTLTGLTATAVLTKLRKREDEKNQGRYRRALLANMALNAAWPYIFFQKKDLGAAALTAGALAVSTAVLANRARPAGKLCKLATVPYLAWTLFATGLSSEIWLRNREG